MLAKRTAYCDQALNILLTARADRPETVAHLRQWYEFVQPWLAIPDERRDYSMLQTLFREKVGVARWSAEDEAAMADALATQGVIGAHQARVARAEVEALPEGQFQLVRQLIDGASSNVARGFLWKALAAGRSVAEVQAFAARIRGLSVKETLYRCTLTDDSGGPGQRQLFQDSCGATTAQVLQAEYDPIFAFEIRSSSDSVAQQDQAQRYVGAQQQSNALLGPGGAQPVHMPTPTGLGRRARASAPTTSSCCCGRSSRRQRSSTRRRSLRSHARGVRGHRHGAPVGEGGPARRR